MSFSLPHTIALLLLLPTLLLFLYRKLTHRSRSLPPGPPPDSWIFGNAIPSAFAYRKFEEWTKTYGPIFSLRQGLTTVVVIGRYDAAVDVMEREGAALVDRPTSIAAGETLSGGMRVLLTPAGERFRKMRKALHAHLSPSVVQTYGPVLMSNARTHILDILDSPEIHQEHAKRYAASVVMALAYGKKAGGHDDPDVQAVNRCLNRLGINLRPGLWKVDVFPLLRYIPGYLDELREGHREELALFKKYLGIVREQMDSPTPPPPSFASYLLSRQSSLSLSDSETAYLAGALFGAGSDTTASAISVGVLAAACYPDAARKVQDEIDRVTGGGVRAPTPSDWEGGKMPQLQAFVLETFRWRPVTAGGFAHKSTKPIPYKNYIIPAGATVIGNVWSVGRDPKYFPDPERFDPQRWIRYDDDDKDDDGEGARVRDDLKSYAFGFGRRVCPGQWIAAASVTLNTALIQWAFTVRPDPAHAPIDELAFTESANAHPCVFHVRFEARVRGGREGVLEGLEGYGEEGM